MRLVLRFVCSLVVSNVFDWMGVMRVAYIVHDWPFLGISYDYSACSTTVRRATLVLFHFSGSCLPPLSSRQLLAIRPNRCSS